jgi:glucosylceramidase
MTHAITTPTPATASARPATSVGTIAQVTTTRFDESGSTVTHTTAPLVDRDDQEFNVVNVYPEVQYQSIDGFGGAITEAAAYTFSLLSPSEQQRVLEHYFSDDHARYSVVRTHLDSCDFSLDQYQALGVDDDESFASFSLARDEQYILPMLRRAQEVAGRPLEIMLSPWSPPAFMKTNLSRTHGGSLLPQYRRFWARYIVRYVQAYRDLGFRVTRITIQNEPNATQTWDSCRFTTAEEKEFLRDFLHPELQRAGLDDVGVHIWDHNKERVYERARDIIDDDTRPMIAGVAFHWYTGEHFDALALVRERYPELKLVFSEGCVEYSRFEPADSRGNAAMYAHDIIGNLNAGMNMFIDWNVLLDAEGGPNHVRNFCAAAIMADPITGEARRTGIYWVMAEFSRNLQPGARRVATTKYTSDLDVVAAQNPDGSLVLIVHNAVDAEREVVVRLEGASVTIAAPAHSLVSVRTPATEG